MLVLEQTLRSEITAHKNYTGYVQKALKEKYPNIAYMFHAFSFSEKAHADNYDRIINTLGGTVNSIPVLMDVGDTRSNLAKSAGNELEKIKTVYPDFLKKLEPEKCEEAIINCMYSWKSHRQHEETVRRIKKYSKNFFGSVAKEIEGRTLDFYVCEMCGSTIDKMPDSPCDICNKSMSRYRKNR